MAEKICFLGKFNWRLFIFLEDKSNTQEKKRNRYHRAFPFFFLFRR